MNKPLEEMTLKEIKEICVAVTCADCPFNIFSGTCFFSMKPHKWDLKND